MEPGARLREAFADPGVTLIAVIGNALEVRLAEMAGFKCAALSSGPVGNGLLGMPDAGMITLTEMEFLMSRIAITCEIPILVDAETGYGNAVNMVRTIRTLEQAGAAGVFIEDQEFPPQASGGGVISLAAMAGKVRAAVDSRRNDSFVIVARTDCGHTLGIDEVIKRGQAFMAEGADAFFFSGRMTPEERASVIEAVPAATHIGAVNGKVTSTDLEAMGYQAACTNHAPTHAGSVLTLRRFEEVLRTGVSGDDEFHLEAEGTPLAGWDLGDHTQISRFDVAGMRAKYIPAED